jgi:hypothetical protein
MSKLSTLCDPDVCYFCGLRKKQTKSKKFRSMIEIHHIIEKNEGGTNEPSNLVPTCSNHHSAIHENIIQLDRWYFSSRGWILHWWDEDNLEHWDNRIIKK